MDEKEIIKEGRHFQKELDLYDWGIRYNFTNLGGGFGDVYIDPSINFAVITIDIKKHFNKKDIPLTLLHEFYHILLVKLDRLIRYGRELTKKLSNSQVQKDLLNNIQELNETWEKLGSIILRFRLERKSFKELIKNKESIEEHINKRVEKLLKKIIKFGESNLRNTNRNI